MITAKKATGTGYVELEVEEPGGTYDGVGQMIELKVSFDLGLEDAYRLAREICDAANARRDELIAEAEEQAKEWGPSGFKEPPGPFIVMPARKLTEEEKAARAAKATKP